MAIGSKIALIYDPSQSDVAQQIMDWLQRDRRAELLSKGDGRADFRASINIASKAAIVLISDDAVENPGWQKAVREIDEASRIIPVGETANADYSDPNVIPKRVEEINFIRIDDHLLENVLDSLVTNPDFYALKNNLMSMTSAWEMTGESDDFLIASFVRARRGLAQIRKKASGETDPYFIDQLERIVAFLRRSAKRSILNKLSAIWRNLKWAAAIVAAAVIVALLVILVPYLRRAN